MHAKKFLKAEQPLPTGVSARSKETWEGIARPGGGRRVGIKIFNKKRSDGQASKTRRGEGERMQG